MKSASLSLIFSSCLLASTFAVITPGSGDLVLGFQATSGTGVSQNLVVDLGNVNVNTITTVLGSLNLNLGTDLSNIYGDNWSTRSDLYWGFISANYPTANGDSANTLYASTQQGNSPWIRATAASQGTTRANVFNLYSQMGTDIVNAQTGTAAGSILMGTAESSSWSAYNTVLGSSFGAFNGSVESSIANNLDIYRLAPSSIAGVAGTLSGTMQLSSSGIVSAVSAVPEPSTNALIIFGSVVLIGFAIRRRMATKA